MSSKPILAIDVDETIGYLLPTLIEYYFDYYGGEQLECKDFFTLDYHKVFGITREEMDNTINAYYGSDHFLKRIQPIPEALYNLIELKNHFELHAVTARPHIVREHTIQWINTHYPGLFSEFHFGNLYAKEGVKKTKSQICNEIGASALVDDCAGYAADCAINGINVILFGDYGWNKNLEEYYNVEHANIINQRIMRAYNWIEVKNIVLNKFLNVDS